MRRALDAKAVSVVDTPRLGIEVTLTDPMIFGNFPLRVFIAADPETGLTFTRMDTDGELADNFPLAHLQEALDTGELIPFIRSGTVDDPPWVDLYAHF